MKTNDEVKKSEVEELKGRSAEPKNRLTASAAARNAAVGFSTSRLFDCSLALQHP
jgi:hypothetical protein